MKEYRYHICSQTFLLEALKNFNESGWRLVSHTYMEHANFFHLIFERDIPDKEEQ